jgi:hypothetical protein
LFRLNEGAADKAEGMVAPAAAPAAVVKNALRFKSGRFSVLFRFIFLLAVQKKVS